MINLYTNTTIGSYTTGTVTCTKNSANVTGSGTTWSEIVNPGDILTLNDDKLYVIKTVNSNTSLTLDKPFAETTVSNSNYRIFLNTAAHFPSDTAAKVERALEQLSDINEAAINNDRTVTAATKVNGKGLSSTMGDINLNPASVNTNRGGTINFHYNQASSATSSIYESSSGRIRLDCDLWMDNYVYSNINLSGGGQIRFSNIDASTNSSERRVFCFSDKGATALGGLICLFTSGNADHSVRLRVHNNGAYNDLGIAKKSDGDVYTFAPTPATNDNSTKIATTAFVNNRLPYTSGTWTPTLAGSETAGTFTYTNVIGFYLKIGKLVYVSWYFRATIDTSKALPTGQVIIKGLPFISRHSHAFNANTTFSKHVDLITVSDGTTYIKFRAYKALTTSDSNYVDIMWGDTDALNTWVPSSINNGQYFFGNILYVTD